MKKFVVITDGGNLSDHSLLVPVIGKHQERLLGLSSIKGRQTYVDEDPPSVHAAAKIVGKYFPENVSTEDMPNEEIAFEIFVRKSVVYLGRSDPANTSNPFQPASSDIDFGVGVSNRMSRKHVEIRYDTRRNAWTVKCCGKNAVAVYGAVGHEDTLYLLPQTEPPMILRTGTIMLLSQCLLCFMEAIEPKTALPSPSSDLPLLQPLKGFSPQVLFSIIEENHAVKGWTKADQAMLRSGMMKFGYGRWEAISSDPQYVRLRDRPDSLKIVMGRKLLCRCYVSCKNATDRKVLHDLLCEDLPTEWNSQQKEEFLALEGSSVSKDSVASEEKLLTRWTRKLRFLKRMRDVLHSDVAELIRDGKASPAADRPTAWWSNECDYDLLRGMYKHGFALRGKMRADPDLCFYRILGAPDPTKDGLNEGIENADLDGEDGKMDDDDDESEAKKKSKASRDDGEEEAKAGTGGTESGLVFPATDVLVRRLKSIIAACMRLVEKAERKTPLKQGSTRKSSETPVKEEASRDRPKEPGASEKSQLIIKAERSVKKEDRPTNESQTVEAEKGDSRKRPAEHVDPDDVPLNKRSKEKIAVDQLIKTASSSPRANSAAGLASMGKVDNATQLQLGASSDDQRDDPRELKASEGNVVHMEVDKLAEKPKIDPVPSALASEQAMTSPFMVLSEPVPEIKNVDDMQIDKSTALASEADLNAAKAESKSPAAVNREPHEIEAKKLAASVSESASNAVPAFAPRSEGDRVETLDINRSSEKPAVQPDPDLAPAVPIAENKGEAPAVPSFSNVDPESNL